MANMNMPDSWQSRVSLTEHLARQLIRGRLGVFLGAGASASFGLPDWNELMRRVCSSLGEAVPVGDFDPIIKAGAIKAKHFASDEKGFCSVVKNALYDSVSIDFATVSENRLLSAVGSLLMSSGRGSVAKVFTLNFDDLLEIFLEYHGFTTAIVHDGCHWAQAHDVVVYHPHGFLPIGRTEVSDRIVLGSTDFFDVMNSDLWRPVIQTALRQHTFLYIGMSGKDVHMQNHWSALTKSHAISKERVMYHGVQFKAGADDDDLSVNMRSWGIFTHCLGSYAELPDFLFGVCQAAREIRSRELVG